MSMIDTAAFFLVLDDFDHEVDHMEPSTLAVNGKVSAVLQVLLVTVTLLLRNLISVTVSDCHSMRLFSV